MAGFDINCVVCCYQVSCFDY